jgi:Glycosyltransferase family 87
MSPSGAPNGPTAPMSPVRRRVAPDAQATVPRLRPAPRPSAPRPPAPGPPRPPRVPAARPEAGPTRWLCGAVLVCWAELLQTVLYSNSGYSWHFFTEGAALLLGQHPAGDVLPGGLHLYANYPQLQFGPLTLLATVALLPFGPAGWMVVVWSMTLSGLLALYVLEGVVRTLRPDLDETPRATAVTTLVGGGSFLVSWELLAVHFGHLDDVLALLLLACAVACVVSRNPLLAGLCLGLAVDAKPWALACAALLFVFPGRERWRAAAAAAGVIAVAWLPFVLADPGTLGAASFTIPNVPASALHALGVNSPTTPSWDRAAQIVLGVGLGWIAVLRRRWEAVFALGIGARIVLDPSVYTYYTAGLALGLLLWDLVHPRRPVPLLSVLCFLGLTLAGLVVRNAHVLGELRLWTVAVAAVVMLAAPRPRGDGVTWPQLLHRCSSEPPPTARNRG